MWVPVVHVVLGRQQVQCGTGTIWFQTLVPGNGLETIPDARVFSEFSNVFQFQGFVSLKKPVLFCVVFGILVCEHQRFHKLQKARTNGQPFFC